LKKKSVGGKEKNPFKLNSFFGEAFFSKINNQQKHNQTPYLLPLSLFFHL